MVSLNPTMQSPHRGGPDRGAVFALFYASGDCTGAQLGVVNSPSQSTAGSWRVLHDSGRAPAHAQSLKLRLAVVQTPQAAAAEVLFDNVLVVRE